MKKRLFRSIVTMISLLTLAGLTTYAVFTAAPVTLANSVTTGSANTAVCDTQIGKWNSTVNTAFAINNLIPGEENEKELTENRVIFLGNDGGGLNNVSGSCSLYQNSPGSSDISMRFIPKVSFTVCSEQAKNGISLDFDMGEGLRSDYRSLKDWEVNAEMLGPVYHQNEARQIHMYALLSLDSNLQDTNCKFDVIFQGVQADEEM